MPSAARKRLKLDHVVGGALALLVQVVFVALVLLSPSHLSRPASLMHETLLFFPPLAVPAPSTIDARGPRRKRIAPSETLPIPPMVSPPVAASPLAPPSGLAGFGRALFGCAPEQYASLTEEQRRHCPKPGEGLAKNDERDLLTPPKSHAKLEAIWQEQWDEAHWMPTPCLPSPGGVASCLLEQSIAENRRAAAAWDKIADDRATALKPKPPPLPDVRQRQTAK